MKKSDRGRNIYRRQVLEKFRKNLFKEKFGYVGPDFCLSDAQTHQV